MIAIGTNEVTLMGPGRKEAAMFEDSLSEGHIYWGRVAAIAAAAVALAYLATIL